MDKTYRLGRRFQKLKYVCIAGELMVIYAFQQLYGMLFPQWNPVWLGVGCGAAAVLAVWGTLMLVAWCEKHLWYEVTREGLRVSRGGTVRLYPWSEFQAAGVDGYNFIARIPVWFQMKDGRRIELEQYVEGLGTLILDILAQIEDHAEISADLRERLKTAQALSRRSQ